MENDYGIQRNGGTYIELACQVASYAERDDLLSDQHSSRDLHHLLGHGGIGIRVNLLDFPSHGALLVKLKEVQALQFWTKHYHGEQRPRSHLPSTKRNLW